MSAAAKPSHLESNDPKRREKAVRELGTNDSITGAQRALLLARLNDDAPRVRHAALEAVGQLAYREIIEPTAELIDTALRLTRDDIEAVRAESAVVLAILTSAPAPKKVVDALHRLLDDNAPVRREAAAALGDVGGEQAQAWLQRHLDDEDIDTRFEVAFALAGLQDASGLGMLTAALEDPKRRLDACEAIARLGEPVGIEPLNALITKRLLPWPDRLTALAALHRLGDPDAGRLLVERTVAWGSAERAMALGLIGRYQIAAGYDALIAVATKKRDRLRGVAVRALGELGSQEGLPTLRAIAEEPKLPEELREELAEAIAKLEA